MGSALKSAPRYYALGKIAGALSAMAVPQIAGYAVTIAVVALVELPLDWLVVVAMLSGGLAVFAVETVLRRKR